MKILRLLPLLLLPILFGCEPRLPSHTFAVITDVHYRDSRDDEYLKAGFEWIKTIINPELVLITGDVTQDGREEQFEGLNALLPSMGVPTYLTPGNHDNDISIDTWDKMIPNMNRYGVKVDIGDWTILGFDSTQGDKATNPVTVQQPAIDLLRSNAATSKQNIIMFTHEPMQNLSGYITNRPAVMEAVAGYDVRHIFCGHAHVYERMCSDATGVTINRVFSAFQDNKDGIERGIMVGTITGDELDVRFVRYPVPPPMLK